MLGDMVPSLRFFFFLSECDGTSKAVVNGLAPGSNGQDKGKVLEEKPGLVPKSISRRCMVCGLGHPASLAGNITG